MVKFGDRIRALADALGKEEQDLAKELGLTKSQMSHYVNGNRKVPSELLQKIVCTYKINPLFLFRNNAPLYDIEKPVEQEYTYLPTAISAGLPINVEAITHSETISLPDNVMGKWAGNKDILISSIYGDSMDKIMPDGTLIAIKPITLSELKDGDIVVFSTNGEYSVKYYYKHPDKIVFKPHSHNKDFYDQPYGFDENITIHGKVVMYIVEMD